ncbi:major facilitator superfamily domain-containing protein [Aspergillus undulatus]|uniref:major facilitator superfamily domain-containing protein n=1 Tax=Aspergillus undulatus TaxID=1810928 RepID=UPI003CCDFFBC
MLDSSIVATAIPQITSRFNSLLDVGWYGSAYQLGYAAFQPMIKTTSLSFFAVFEIGSAICGAATSSKMLITGRALGIACGPLLGGAFTERVSWRWCFYINLPVGAVVFVLLLFYRLPGQPERPRPREVLRNQYVRESSRVIGLFTGSGDTFLVFLIWEYSRGDSAMIPFSLLRQRIVWSASTTMFFFCGVLYLASYYLPIYFQVVKNDTALMSGVHLLPWIFAQVLLALTAGAMIHRFGYYLPSIVIGTVLTTVAHGLYSTFDSATPSGRWIAYEILYGAGSGMTTSIPFIAIPSLIAKPQIPTVMAIVIFMQFLGGAIILSAEQKAFSNSLRDLLTEHLPGANVDAIIAAGARSIRDIDYTTAIQRVFYLGVGVSGAAFVFCWGLVWKDIHSGAEAWAQGMGSSAAD